MIGNIVLLSENNLDSQKVIDIHDINEVYNGIEHIYFVLASESTVEMVNINVSFCGDNSTYDIEPDCVINVLDYIKLVDIILEGSNIYDIADTISLIEEIIEVP